MYEDEQDNELAKAINRLDSGTRQLAEKYLANVKGFANDTIFMFRNEDRANAEEYTRWNSHGSQVKQNGALGTKDFNGAILQLFVNMRKPLYLDFHGHG